MKPLLTSERFQAELPGWALRGVVCALMSFYLAIQGGFGNPAEIAGMILGVGFWVAVFTWAATWLPANLGSRWARIGQALKKAAWIKSGITLLSWLLILGLQSSSLFPAMGPDRVLLVPDMLLGWAALRLVGWAGGFRHLGKISSQDSCGWTALTTIVDGALMAVLIGLIALVVLGWWRLREDSDSRSELSPARL
jgi:hypothetical protein